MDSQDLILNQDFIEKVKKSNQVYGHSLNFACRRNDRDKYISDINFLYNYAPENLKKDTKGRITNSIRVDNFNGALAELITYYVLTKKTKNSQIEYLDTKSSPDFKLIDNNNSYYVETTCDVIVDAKQNKMHEFIDEVKKISNLPKCIVNLIAITGQGSVKKLAKTFIEDLRKLPPNYVQNKNHSEISKSANISVYYQILANSDNIQFSFCMYRSENGCPELNVLEKKIKDKHNQHRGKNFYFYRYGEICLLFLNLAL